MSQIATNVITANRATARKPMMALGEKRIASMPSAEPSSTSAVPPNTKTPPLNASFMRQRRRTSLMTNVNCARGSFPSGFVIIELSSHQNAGVCDKRLATTLSATSSTNPTKSRNHQKD